jgi:adenine-specific DNA-methyltransferase
LLKKGVAMPNRLELTWIGKENRPRLEPRILLEDASKSYHAKHRSGEKDIFDNRLIFGDNLLALKALEQEFTGTVKCVYIDPPYNTGNAFEHYEDGVEHSIWLGLMRDRLELLKRLLAKDGSIWISIDNREQPYLRVLCDEVFGRSNFRSNIVWKKVSSAKTQSNFLGNVIEYILLYSKSDNCSFYPQYIKSDEEKDYKNYPYIEEETGRRFGSFDFTQKGQGTAKVFWGEVLEPPEGKHWIWTQDNIDAGIKNNLLIKTASGLPRLKRYYDTKKGNYLSDLWNDEEVAPISANSKEGLNFFGQKPEGLIKRIIALATNPGDLVLDSFAGSGTTGAVAHKMGRRWIMIELGEHCHTHIIPRLKKVIDGEDSGGVSEAVGWKGGGGFRYYRLAPSLLQKENQSIDPKVNEDLFDAEV